MTLKRSWVESANNADTQFPLNNLPYGVFSTADKDARCGVAIGDHVLDLKGLESEGVIAFDGVFESTNWNSFMALGQTQWKALRARLMELLAEASNHRDVVEKHLVDLENAQLHLPISVTEFTDFYAGKNHATNVGTMFRGAENALPPNWLHIPIGYNGRASSVVVSGTDIRRPWGQLKGPDDPTPRWAPSQRFDIELEMGAIIGAPSNGPISVDQADANIFGYVMLNDWSARDIQAWEYQPLGPFQAKATATTISPWIVSPAALDPFRCATPAREKDLLPHLRDTGPMLFDIDLSVTLNHMTICETNYREMYYSAAQQLAHHTTSGCPMRVGDLIGSGTISGAEKHQRGSLLELSWGGKEPFTLPNGETRSFVNDGDVLEFHGAAKGNGYQIGFGPCSGKLLPALDDPFQT
jgi:fumarylacetoacetase